MVFLVENAVAMLIFLPRIKLLHIYSTIWILGHRTEHLRICLQLLGILYKTFSCGSHSKLLENNGFLAQEITWGFQVDFFFSWLKLPVRERHYLGAGTLRRSETKAQGCLKYLLRQFMELFSRKFFDIFIVSICWRKYILLGSLLGLVRLYTSIW